MAILRDYQNNTPCQFFNAPPVKRCLIRFIQMYGGGGSGGTGVQSVIAGTGITVDNSDPQNPVISATTPAVSNIYTTNGTTTDQTRTLTIMSGSGGQVIFQGDQMVNTFHNLSTEFRYGATGNVLTIGAGGVTAPTVGIATNNTQVATTAFVQALFVDKYKGGQSPFTADATTTVFDITHNLGAIPSYFSLSTTEPIALNHLGRTITFPDNNTMRLTFNVAPAVGEDANYVWIVYK